MFEYIFVKISSLKCAYTTSKFFLILIHLFDNSSKSYVSGTIYCNFGALKRIGDFGAKLSNNNLILEF